MWNLLINTFSTLWSFYIPSVHKCLPAVIVISCIGCMQIRCSFQYSKSYLLWMSVTSLITILEYAFAKCFTTWAINCSTYEKWSIMVWVFWIKKYEILTTKEAVLLELKERNMRSTFNWRLHYQTRRDFNPSFVSSTCYMMCRCVCWHTRLVTVNHITIIFRQPFL